MARIVRPGPAGPAPMLGPPVPNAKADLQMRQRSRLAALAVLALPLATAAACSGGAGEKSADDLKEDLSETFQEGASALSEEDADCIAGVVVDELGEDRLQDVSFDDEEPPAEIQEDFADAVLTALGQCETDITTDEENGE